MRKAKNIIISCAIALSLSIFLLIFPDFCSKMTDQIIDALFILRGSRQVSDEIFFISIDSHDLQELNQWPITRDYYGYLTHILKQAGARIIGFDILFTTASTRYPEYDNDFSQFLRSSGNVCLPFFFSDLTDTYDSKHQSFLLGNSPQFPVENFKPFIIGTGFSNLLDETIVRRYALTALADDSLYNSFGLELARLFCLGKDATVHISPKKIRMRNSSQTINISTDSYSRVRLNHFGALDKIHSMSMIDVLQTYQNNPEQLNLTDKLVLVGFNAPGAAPMKVTPFHSSFPASLIHFTAAENILQNNFIRTLPPVLIILFLFIFALFIALAISLRRQNIILILACFVIYLLAAVLLFKVSSLSLPIALPSICLLSSSTILLLLHYREKNHMDKIIRDLYRDQINKKQQLLQEAEANIQEMQNKQEMLSSEAQQRLEKKQTEILRLEEELRDLQTATTATKSNINEKYSTIIHSPKSRMVSILELVEKVSSDDIPVFIFGETGTGKEVIARAIHESGLRSSKKFIAVNCASCSFLCKLFRHLGYCTAFGILH